MGFIEGVRQVGRWVLKKVNENSELFGNRKDIAPFVESPVGFSGKVLTINLVADGVGESGPIKVLDLEIGTDEEFWAGVERGNYVRELNYLTRIMWRRDLSNAYRFSPVFFPSERGGKLDFNKLLDQVKKAFREYETNKVFVDGTFELIESKLKNIKDEVLKKAQEFYKNKSNKYISLIILFKIIDKYSKKEFYPGDINLFIDFFRIILDKKIQPSSGQFKCSLCGKEDAPYLLNKIFVFGTYDKRSFLPALISDKKYPMFPVCESCFRELSAGKNFVDIKLSQKVGSYRCRVFPEVVGFESSEESEDELKVIDNFVKAFESEESKHFKDQAGKISEKREQWWFNRLSKAGKGLVFYFMFYEPAGKEIIHSLVEDVPPSLLSRISSIWNSILDKAKVYGGEKVVAGFRDFGGLVDLMFGVFSQLAGKSEEEKKVFSDFVLSIIDALMSERRVNTYEIKKRFVSKIRGIIFDDVGIGRSLTIRFLYLVEFFEKFNEEAKNG